MVTSIESQADWENKFKIFSHSTFLQSWAWSQFQMQTGNQVFHWQIDNGVNLSLCSGVEIQAKRAKFLLIPHGPLLGEDKNLAKIQLQEWLQFLIGFSREKNYHFLRMQTILGDTPENKAVFENHKFRLAPIHMHTEYTSVLDLVKTEEQLLMGMRKTTRQMINKALKLVDSGNIRIEYPQVFTDEMYQVYTKTTHRGDFVGFSQEYLAQEYQAFAKNQQAVLINIRHNQKLLAWGMILFSNNKAFYHQGANIPTKNIPAFYLTHWLAILEAKNRGCTSYDFWGVSPQGSINHPWQNISFFKRGFGGQDASYLPAQDYILKPLRYWPNWLLESYRASKRGLSRSRH